MSKSSKSAKAIAALVTVVMVLALAGCASGTGSSGGGAGVVTVKIGVGAPLTQGVVSFGEGIVRATQLAVDQANASERAKAAGIKFVVVPGDDQGDPKTGVTVANQFASDPSLVGVVGHVNSGVSIPASAIYNRANIVMIAPSSTDPKLTQQGFKNIFRTCTIDTVQGSFAGDAAFKDLGYKTAFVVDDSSQYGSGLADFFTQQFEADGGQVLGREKTNEKDTDYKPLAVKIAAAKPDVVYYGGLYQPAALFVRQLRESGVSAGFFGGDGLYDAQFVKLAGESAAEGAFSTSIGLPFDQLPQATEFKAAFTQMFPGKEIAAYDAYGYDAANVIINAVLTAAEDGGAANVTSPQGRAKIIAAAGATNLEGVTGKLAFDANGDTLNKAITLYTVKSGAWTAYVK